MKTIYNPYVTSIRNAISKGARIAGIREESLNFSGRDHFEKASSSQIDSIEPETGMQELARLLGIKHIRRPILGDHPDFTHIRQTQRPEKHYIVSVFLDVKGSTNLHKKHTLEEIRVIIQSFISAATHTCALFGGHIQRLQGDGVFAYFGGRNVNKAEAVESAITASGFFSYFMRFELKRAFQEEDLAGIFTRIGIDFGDDHQVEWAVFGPEGCSELTTNSLHTSLAPKMQAQAENYGIVIGDNAYRLLTAQARNFCTPVKDDRGNTVPAYRDDGNGILYKQYHFRWDRFLVNKYKWFAESADGGLEIDTSQYNTAQERLDVLLKSLPSENAYIDKKGINSNSGIVIPKHNFHYDPFK
ncbi:MAG: hypothetical protein L6Q81_05020 [Bacteroidia bacterium]|nr:hypothetical protein [Bacteroidia bacterium]